jgi:hypothetical protein
MSDAGNTGTPPAGTPPPPPPPPPGDKPGATKDQLDNLNTWAQSFAAREKAEGKAAVERDIAEKLGMTLDEAATLLESAKETERAKMTEAERKLAEAGDKETKVSAVQQSANQIIYDGLCQDALMSLGMDRDQAKAATGLMKVKGQPTVEAFVAAAEAVRVGFPQLFASSGGNGGPGATDGQRRGPVDSATPGGPPAGGSGGETAKDRALARLRKEKGGRLKMDLLPRQDEIDQRRGT